MASEQEIRVEKQSGKERGSGAGDDEDRAQDHQIAGSRKDPLYLLNSDHPGMLLTGTKFDGKGFVAWKRNMEIVLFAKNKLGFVDGTLRKESLPASKAKEWEMVDRMVTSWLLTALERDIAESVVFNSSAESIWSELSSRFEEKNVAKLYALEQELATIKQGEDTVRAYYTRVKRIWDQIDSTDTLPACSCTARNEFREYVRRQRTIKFLMSVNPRFEQVRGNVLMMAPLPSIEQIYSLLVQEERQKRSIHGCKLRGELCLFCD